MSSSVSILDFGAIGDGVHDDTPSFQNALAWIRKRGGGTLIVPGSDEERVTYLISPIDLTSNLVLQLERGATILGIPNHNAWPLVAPLPSYGRGRDHAGPRYKSLLQGVHLENVEIRGEGRESVLDGNGDPYWYDMRHEKRDNFTRGM